MPGNAAICTGATVTSVTTVALPAARSSGEWNVWTHRRPAKRISRAVFVRRGTLPSGPLGDSCDSSFQINVYLHRVEGGDLENSFGLSVSVGGRGAERFGALLRGDKAVSRSFRPRGSSAANFARSSSSRNTCITRA
jgi:hypothetical protein